MDRCYLIRSSSCFPQSRSHTVGAARAPAAPWGTEQPQPPLTPTYSGWKSPPRGRATWHRLQSSPRLLWGLPGYRLLRSTSRHKPHDIWTEFQLENNLIWGTLKIMCSCELREKNPQTCDVFLPVGEHCCLFSCYKMLWVWGTIFVSPSWSCLLQTTGPAKLSL